MWIIVSFVTAAIFGSHPHPFSSVEHFPTKEACEAAMPDDADDLLDELSREYGLRGKAHLEAHCEIDTDGNPA